MVVDERSRHELYRRLEEVLGPDAATTLIEHLPPVGWSDVATKGDLAALEQRIDLRFARIDERFNSMEERSNFRFDAADDHLKTVAADLRSAFEHELRSQITTIMFGLASVVLTMVALAFALRPLHLNQEGREPCRAPAVPWQ